jgi:hypothetical protein
MGKTIAVLFAAGALLLPPSFASAQTGAIDFSRTAFLIGASDETQADNFAKDFDPYDVFSGHSATMLAVNGRVVAIDDEPAAATANGWNWTLLLLGCAGLWSWRGWLGPRRGAPSFPPEAC